MKMFGYKLRLFSKKTTTLKAIETWCVKWESLHRDCIDKGVPKTNVQGFPSKTNADIFAKELNDCRRLLGDNGFKAFVYKQETPTNKS